MSIILPTRNRGALLPRAIDSVLRQSFADFELIVVDDASTDDTRAIVAAIGDPRVRYLALERHSHPARARNTGIRAARADTMAFQDSDDEWLPRKLELQLELLNRSPQRTGLVVGAYEMVEPRGRRIVRSAALEAGVDYGLDIVRGFPLVTPLWLARRAALEQAGMFDETLASSEDYELAFRLSRVCAFRAVPEVVLVKTGHAESLTADNRLLLRGLETVYGRYPEFWRPYPDERIGLFHRIAALRLRTGSRAGAAAALLRAWTLRPWRLSALWRALALLAGRHTG